MGVRLADRLYQEMYMQVMVGQLPNVIVDRNTGLNGWNKFVFEEMILITAIMNWDH